MNRVCKGRLQLAGDRLEMLQGRSSGHDSKGSGGPLKTIFLHSEGITRAVL